MIKTLKGLYRVLDILFRGIDRVCQECQGRGYYDDCRGYIWLLPEEARRLYNAGVEIVEINNRVRFLNSFSNDRGEIDVEQFKPPCPWCKSKGCSIYKMRPLVCRLYPLGFSLEDDIMCLVLYVDCLFSERRMSDPHFQEQARALLKRIDPKLLRRILRTYEKVLSISRFPQGPNKVVKIVSLYTIGRR